jgi:uridylate kinase
MKKEMIVLSLGGSLIIPDKVDSIYLKKFKEVILKNTKKYKFIIVCGGGSIARKYISALKEIKVNEKLQSFAGISSTRMNARFMNYFFNINPKYGIPHTIKVLKKYIKNKDVVFCGALEYKPNQTSDSTAAGIAKKFKTTFINLTNVPGLYNKNPKKFKNAKFISEISWKEFFRLANKTKFKPGQHFVLDQAAAGIIMKHKIPTYILGKNLQQLNNLLKNKKFKGTTIQGVT